jgi:hypothetical protein
MDFPVSGELKRTPAKMTDIKWHGGRHSDHANAV